MWHVGVHVWEVPWNELEPNYDEYYAVRTSILFSSSSMLITAGEHGVQPPQHPHTTSRQSFDYPPSAPSRLSHRMAQARSLRYIGFHCWKRIDTLVSLHFHLSTTDRKHLEAQDFRQPTLHGAPQDGRNAHLGYMRQPPHRSFDSPDTIHHRSKNDERAVAITTCRSSSVHLQSCGHCNWRRENLPILPRPPIHSLQARLDVSHRLLHQPY